MRTMLSAFLLAAAALPSQRVVADVAKIDTAAQLLPPGAYECKMGAYAFRACDIVAKGQGVELVIRPDIGHFIQFRAELLPSDDKGQMTLLGAPTAGQNLCDACKPGDGDSDRCVGGYQVSQACLAQPLVARLKVSGGGARGTLMYYINRPSYTGGKYTGYFKLGNTIEFTIRPKKK